MKEDKDPIVIKDYEKYRHLSDGQTPNFKNGVTKKPDAIAYIEKHYPETAKEFQRLQFEQYNLFCKKQMDYGPSNIAMGTSLDTDEEKRLSKIGLIVRINDKIQRLINLVVKHNRSAQNEPTIDAFKDLACYGIIAQIVEAGKWGK
tara:strand:- start:7 stop:444 length:438 start_codon:yes stop_codon:yes gene_type:complete